MRLFGRVAEGESYQGSVLSWCHADGWFRIVLCITQRYHLYARLRWNPKPVCLILMSRWETDKAVDWLPETRVWGVKSKIIEFPS